MNCNGTTEDCEEDETMLFSMWKCLFVVQSKLLRYLLFAIDAQRIDFGQDQRNGVIRQLKAEKWLDGKRIDCERVRARLNAYTHACSRQLQRDLRRKNKKKNKLHGKKMKR